MDFKVLRRELHRLVDRDRGYARAKAALLARTARGSSLGQGPFPSHEDLYDRAQLR